MTKVQCPKKKHGSKGKPTYRIKDKHQIEKILIKLDADELV